MNYTLANPTAQRPDDDDDKHDFRFERQEDKDRFFRLLEQFHIPRTVFAATEVSVHAVNNDWDAALAEARVWAWCWREYRGRRRASWIPTPEDYERAERGWQ